jgi:hypothetical protein
MTIEEALAEVDRLGLTERLNTNDVFAVAELLQKSVNDAFDLGRLDKEVVG